jgi:hypothetical protein
MPRDCGTPADGVLRLGCRAGRCEVAGAGGDIPFLPGGHHRPRGQEGAHPDRVSRVGNVATPSRSGQWLWLVGRP